MKSGNEKAAAEAGHDLANDRGEVHKDRQELGQDHHALRKDRHALRPAVRERARQRWKSMTPAERRAAPRA